MVIQQVLVKYQDNYYQCLYTQRGFKCGKCLFGVINPFGNKRDQDHKCKRCGAELFRTRYDEYSEITPLFVNEYAP